MFDLLLAGLPAELLSAMRKNKLTNPRTLRFYPRSALGISTGVLTVPDSTSTPTDPGTLLLPTFAPDPYSCEPEDPDGLPTVAERQGGSGRHDGSTGTGDANEETSVEGQGLLGECSELGQGVEGITRSAEPERADGLTVTVAVGSDVLSDTSVSRTVEHADGLPRGGLDSHSSGQVITRK